MRHQSRERLAVLVPVRNEELSISKVLHDFAGSGLNAEIHVIENGSTDGTIEVARRTMGRLCDPRIHLHQVAAQGKGDAVRWGLENVRAEAYGLIDGDGSYAMSDFVELWKTLDAGADMVVGDRLSQGDYRTRHGWTARTCGNWWITALVERALGLEIRDLLSGQRVFNRAVRDSLDLVSRGFEIDAELTVKALRAGMRVVAQPIAYGVEQRLGESKLRFFVDGAAILMMLGRELGATRAARRL